MDELDVDGLRAEIEAQHGTIYKFCKVTALNKSTVYMVLAGTYPGDSARQAARIRAALAGDSPWADRVRQALEHVACSRCRKRRTCDRTPCARLFDAQARAVLDAFSQMR